MTSGLKENVIIGRLIPAGTGYKDSKKFARVAELQETFRHEVRDAEETERASGVVITAQDVE